MPRQLIVTSVVVGPFDVNCLLLQRDAGLAVVVDPGADAPLILEALDRLDLRVSAYLLTHGHMDHISALADLAGRQPAPIYLHARDQAWAFSQANQMPPFYPVPERPTIQVTDIAEGQKLPDHALAAHVLHTPGHTPGCCCFHFPDDDVLLSGDTLFQGSAGRTDLPGGDARTLAVSLRRLSALPSRTRIYPGHGPSTTLGEEVQHNVFLRRP